MEIVTINFVTNILNLIIFWLCDNFNTFGTIIVIFDNLKNGNYI